MTDTPNDWTDNDLEQLSRIAPNDHCVYHEALWEFDPATKLHRHPEGTAFVYPCSKGNIPDYLRIVDEDMKTLAKMQAAPSDRAGKIREDLLAEVRRILNRPRRAGEDSAALELTQYVRGLLASECKVAVASALEQAAKASCQLCAAGLEVSWDRTPVEVPEYGQPGTWWHRLTSGRGHDRCAAPAIRALSPSPNYIALREAEARLEVLPKLGLLPEPLASEVAKYQAALTEERDRIAKETK